MGNIGLLKAHGPSPTTELCPYPSKRSHSSLTKKVINICT